jgi:3-hydroxyisobutyrate dehydrogenase
MTTTSVALLGVGTMGAGMARNIAAAGMPVRVWNRTREKAQALADVAEVCDTAADAVRGADVVVTMLYDTESIVATMSGLGSLGGDTVWLQTSTVGVAGSARLGALASHLGIGYVDAPVLGTKKPAEDGTLTVLASGDSSLEARVSGVTDAIGARTLWVGEAGAGSRLKLACNAFVATMTQGIAESLAMTEALGLDPSLFLEAVRGAAVDAPYVQVKGRAMVDGQFAPAFRLAAVVKDLDLMLEATEPTGYSPALVPVLRRYFSAAVDRGLGDKDMAAIYLALDT